MPMQQLLLAAALAHPERAEYDRAVSNGVEPERAGRLLSTQAPLTLRSGRSTWHVQNNPASLESHAAAAAKCPGFNGKRTPKPRATKGGGQTYWHAEQGFKLWIPATLITTGESKLQIGGVTLTLLHTSRRIKGKVPASWLVDLNAGGATTDAEETPEECSVEDLL